jgi:predicted transglutaminase-like cysteine proteinase
MRRLHGDAQGMWAKRDFLHMRIAGPVARRQLVGGVVVFMLSLLMAAAPASAAQAIVPKGFQAFCAANPSECKGGGASSVTYSQDLVAQLKAVNAKVNASIKPVKSEKGDVWSLNVSTGDCEEYVLAKRKALIRAGMPASALSIMFVLANGEGHAVLGVQTDKGLYVLDNLNRSIKPIGSTGYKIISRSGPNPKVWVRA